ncbi:MAG: hypothetical protein NVS2B4_18520 [Ramlibacter sp.]
MADKQQRQLTALVVRRRQLVAMLVAGRQRLAVAHPKAKRSILRIMDAIAAQLHDVDAELKNHIHAHHSDLAKLLTLVKSVGPTTASTLLAQLPELGMLNRVALVDCLHKRLVSPNAFARTKSPWSNEIAKVI